MGKSMTDNILNGITNNELRASSTPTYIIYANNTPGIVGDGSDCTSALQTLINNTSQGTILFAIGTYVMKDVYLHENITLKSESSAIQYSNNYSPPVIFKAAAGAVSVLNTTCSGISLEGIIIDGNNNSSDGIGSSGAYNQTYRNCRFTNCKTGLGANYKGDYTGMMMTVYIDNCFFMNNGTGVDNLIDSKILNSFFVGNSYAGIRLFGADNIVTGNKIEWNNYGIKSMYGNHCTIANNIFDANNLPAISMDQYGDKTTIANNIFRRNGIAATLDREKSHLDIEGTGSLVLSGNVTVADYPNDQHTGNLVPLHSIVINNARNILATGNDLSGCTGTQIVQAASTNIQIDSARLSILEGAAKNTCIKVSAVSNIYKLDLSSTFNFVIETLDKLTKTITFTNVPNLANSITSISVILKFTNNATILFPSGTVWKDQTKPTFVVGKKYMLSFVSYDNGVSYLASYIGAW